LTYIEGLGHPYGLDRDIHTVPGMRENRFDGVTLGAVHNMRGTELCGGIQAETICVHHDDFTGRIKLGGQ
jgi:hypothetical protein